jgi:hypothetical protein
MSRVPIITRAQWGARAFVRPRRTVSLSMREWFIIHYPGAGTPPNSVGEYAKWIEQIHVVQNGWSGVGYNFFGAHGQIAEGCGQNIVGAHSPEHNVDGIGVNLWTSHGRPEPETQLAVRELYEDLCDRRGRRLKIGWHGMDYATECPGPILRDWARRGMPVDKVIAPVTPPRPVPPLKKEGIFGMTDTQMLDSHHNWDLKPGAEVSIQFPGGPYSLLTGPVQFEAHGGLEVSGIPEGQVVDLFWSIWKGDKEARPLNTEQLRSAGKDWSKNTVSTAGKLAAGEALRLRVRNRGTKTVRVERQTVSTLSDKEN